jgi:hypothetical protein
VKRSSRDESVWVVIHICIKTTQGNSLCCYLYKSENRRAELVLPMGGGRNVGTGEREEVVEKGVGR